MFTTTQMLLHKSRMCVFSHFGLRQNIRNGEGQTKVSLIKFRHAFELSCTTEKIKQAGWSADIRMSMSYHVRASQKDGLTSIGRSLLHVVIAPICLKECIFLKQVSI